MAPPPELSDDVVGEILLRIDPAEPALLFRASLTCKPWRRLLTDPAFLRRYRAFHRMPPVLGFVRNKDLAARFIRTTAFPPLDLQRRNCRVLDCRHGRVLLSDYSTRDFVVWDPIIGEDQRIPNKINSYFNAAVLCAVADCDHLDCHGGPFLVVLVATVKLVQCTTFAWVYSSEAGKWSAETTVQSNYYMDKLPPVLAGDALYFISEHGWAIFRYDLCGEGGLSVIDGAGPDMYISVVLIPAEDGALRFAGLDDYILDLWSLDAMDPDRDAAWTQHGVIRLDMLLSVAGSMCPPDLIGFAKASGSDVIFVNTTYAGVFMIELESHKVRKVYDKDCGHHPIFPYTSFFTPECAVGRLSLP